jgi:predicted MPP superfamily phosphohydrolase
LAIGCFSCLIEPEWLKIKTVRISKQPTHRLVQISDIHHKGDCEYLQNVVNKVNRLSPDVVCFTGDLIERAHYLHEALEILSKINAPIYGIPGNHDYWSQCNFSSIRKCFEKTGGEWLPDKQAQADDGKLHFTGVSWKNWRKKLHAPETTAKKILLLHYPMFVTKLAPLKYDLILAGHSHGGQVRIPLLGPISLPTGVGPYDKGLYQTEAGPLYVNPGIGYLANTSVRFNCRPEITVFEL